MKNKSDHITPEEAKRLMSEISERTIKNTELFHISADELMVQILRQQGFGDAVDIFESRDRWYS